MSNAYLVDWLIVARKKTLWEGIFIPDFAGLGCNILKILNKLANEFHQIGELRNGNPILFKMVKNILAKFGFILAYIEWELMECRIFSVSCLQEHLGGERW